MNLLTEHIRFRIAYWACICIFAVASHAQAQDNLHLTNTTISSGTVNYSANINITADTGFTVNGSAFVTFSAGQSINLGPGFQATGGGAATTFHALIGAPDFTLSVPFTQYPVLPGGNSGPIPVTITGINGFNSQVTFSYSWPAGLTAIFSPNPATGSTSLTVSAAQGTAAGQYQLIFSGTAPGLTHNALVNISVQDFSVAAPKTQTIAPGQYVSNLPVIITNLNGFSGPVSLSWTSIPSGFSPYFSQFNGVPTIFLTTANTLVSGTYTLGFQGASGPTVHASSLTVTIDKLTTGANLGPLAFDNYDDVFNNAVPQVVPGCSSSLSVRQCYRNVLSTYAAAGASSVRFMAGLSGASSTALDSVGNIKSLWLSRLNEFFQDMYNAGITHAIVNPVLDPTWGTQQGIDEMPNDNCTQGSPTITLEFRPHLPFGYKYDLVYDPKCQCLVRKNYQPQCGGANGNLGAPNIYNFWGWSYLYTLADDILATAAAQGVTVDEFDLLNEADLTNWTIYEWLLYDPNPSDKTQFAAQCNQVNFSGEAVLCKLQSVMASRMGQAAQYQVVFSEYDTNSTILSSSQGSDCLSVYSDSARILSVSEFLAATAGGLIGIPSGINPPATGGLACGGGTGTMFEPSQYISPTPTVIDLHTKPDLVDINGGGLNTDVQGQGTLTFNAVKSMLDSYGPSGWRIYNPTVYNSFAVFGETWKPVTYSTDKNGGHCGTDPPNADGYNYSAFTASNMRIRPSALLPWVNLVNGCFAYPPQINPPYRAGP